MKWSRFAYCAAFTVGTGVLIKYGVSPWLTIPLCAFAAWWSFQCTYALWSEFSFRTAIWRAHQAPSLELDRKIQKWEWLSNPKLDFFIKAGTVIAALFFPTLLWFPLFFWVLMR
jgi:hypothetical protein